MTINHVKSDTYQTEKKNIQKVCFKHTCLYQGIIIIIIWAICTATATSFKLSLFVYLQSIIMIMKT